MKLSNLALHGTCLFILSLVVQPVLATDLPTEKASTYQSSFDDYKALADDSPADWKAINAQSKGSGHSMHSMQHQMSPEQMANMPSEKEAPADKSMPAMEGMDHSDMQAMDHSQIKHDHMMAPMEGMDHVKMAGMDHGEIKAMPSNEKPAMQHMDHAQMQGMHSQGEPMLTEPTSDESTQHDHSEMAMATAKPATPQNQYLQIIPNLHPMVVHFPIALTMVAFLFSLASYMLRNHVVSAQLAAAGHFTLWLAALGAATAVLFGWLAFNSVNHDDAGHAAMLLHRAWAVPTAIGLILLASWDAWKHRVNELMSVPALILLFVLSETVAVTGWLGGEVVYRHGIGVLSLPVSKGVGHSHHHEHGIAEPVEPAHAMSEATDDKHADELTEHHHDDEKGESHEH